jgi:O-methyltransferase
MFSLASQYVPMVARGGSYVEFGVFDGNSMTIAYHALKGVCKSFYAFDSFQGIGGALESEATRFRDGQYAASLETFRYNLRFNNVDERRVQVVPGFFQETLRNRTPADLGIDKASIAHIDTDVYEPALLSLEFIAPALPQGALLLFDDYDQLAASNDRGERRAIREWLKAHPELELEPYRNYGVACRAFIVHRLN